MGRSAGAALGQAPAAAKRREVSIAGKRIKVIDVHCHCVVDVAEVVKDTPLAKSARRRRQPGARPAAAADHGSAGRRRAGADDQRVLVVRGRSRPRAADRAGPERGAGEVGGGAPGSVRRARVGRPAASGSGGRAARTRRQTAGPARRHDWRSRQRRRRVAAEVRSVLGQGRRARRAGVHASGRARTTSSARARCGDAAIWATSSATRWKPPTSSPG